jgi:hypothetical protein
MTERKRLLDAVFIPLVNHYGSTQTTAALGAFALAEVAAASLAAQDFASRCDFEALGYRFLRFDTFGTSHNSIFR